MHHKCSRSGVRDLTGVWRSLAEHTIALTLTILAASIMLHGISVTPLMDRYARRKAQRSGR
mgnify:CR=1 FL=1